MDPILYETFDNVALLTLNRPEKLNAFTQRSFDLFVEGLQRAGQDETVRCIVIIGRGRAFSSGIDLDMVADMMAGESPLQKGREFLEAMQDVTRLMLRLQKPIIAAVNGVAVGVGAEIAISADIRLGCDATRFIFAEVKRGLFETNGVTYLLPRIVGHGRAMEMMLRGTPIDAEECVGIGLLNRLYPSTELQGRALDMAREIAANAPLSIGWMKRAVLEGWEHGLEHALALEVKASLVCMQSEDQREGVRAFLEKRQPVWKGR
jgi:enoyl-CoA hydratase/carnithine racemase